MASAVLVALLLLSIIAVKTQTPRSDDNRSLLESVTSNEQRAWIKIECVAGTAPAEIARRLNAILGEQAYSERHVRRLCQEFTVQGRCEAAKQPPPGRPRCATSDNMAEQLIDYIVKNDGASTVELATQLDIGLTSVRTLLHEAGYQHVRGKWIPHTLDPPLREKRVRTAQNNLARLSDDPKFLDRIIAIDETWLPLYMPVTDAQSGQWVPPGEEA